MGLLLALGLGFAFGVGYGLIGLGIFLAPTAFYARRDDKKVRALDAEVSTFIRSLGALTSAAQSTVSTALNHVDSSSMGGLEPHIMRLRTRLVSQLPTDISWNRLKSETGNELLSRSTDMLVDAVELGADAEEVGEIAAGYATTVSELRETRQMTADSFGFLVIPMHIAMTGLLLFVLEIVASFDEQLRNVASGLGGPSGAAASAFAGVPGLDAFQAQDLTLVTGMITITILTLTIANALVSKFASGGHNLKIAYPLSIMCLASGINMVVIPVVARGLFS